MRSHQKSPHARQVFNVLGTVLIVILACAWTRSSIAASQSISLDTPPGITIQELVGQKLYKRGPSVQVYADASGMTLYTSSADEKGKSKCTGECAKLWIPAKATTK